MFMYFQHARGCFHSWIICLFAHFCQTSFLSSLSQHYKISMQHTGAAIDPAESFLEAILNCLSFTATHKAWQRIRERPALRAREAGRTWIENTTLLLYWHCHSTAALLSWPTSLFIFVKCIETSAFQFMLLTATHLHDWKCQKICF